MSEYEVYMIKHHKLIQALLVLMAFVSVSMFALPSDAVAAQSLVENSWRYDNGQSISESLSSDDEGISLLSLDALPNGATA